MTLSTIMGLSYACLGGVWDAGTLERDRVRNLYLSSAITLPGLCAAETPLGPLSRPTLRRSTPVATTALSFSVRLDAEGTMELQDIVFSESVARCRSVPAGLSGTKSTLRLSLTCYAPGQRTSRM